MTLQELEALLAELLQAVNLVMESGEELTDDEMGMVANTLELLSNRILEIREPTGPAHPELTQAMPSSNVEGFAYDYRNNRMYVRFLGKYPNRQGPVYQYEGVPQGIFHLFRSGAIPAKTKGKNRWGRWWVGKKPSIGASMYALIKERGYDYRRVA